MLAAGTLSSGTGAVLAQLPPGALSEADLELMESVSRPIAGEEFDIEAVDIDLIRTAGRHRHPDPRNISFLVVDELVEEYPQTGYRALTGPGAEPNPGILLENFLPDFALTFLTYTKNFDDPWVRELKESFIREDYGFREPDQARLHAALLDDSLPAILSITNRIAVDHPLLVIHGSWARQETWWRLGSTFTNYLQSVSGLTAYEGGDPFLWSGKPYIDEIRKGAERFIAWNRAHNINSPAIVAHSHGGNVVMMATHLGLQVEKLVLLGTPIRTECTPYMPNIGSLVNIYSEGDLIQRKGCFPNPRGDGRTLGDSDELLNIHIVGQGHSELHDEKVWISNYLDRFLK